VETTRITEYYLQMRYGQAVQVSYVDMADAANQAQFSDVLAIVQDQSIPYPLVAINGELRIAGSAHFYRVLPMVEELLQPQAEKTQP
jgi:disulfide oxidoreductase YuzD